jgi:TIR domain/HEAT repeats
MLPLMPTQIFLSHITVEHDLAALLKQKVEKHFLEQVDVFVSSDQESIQAGEPWLDALQRSLTTASMAIILCSPVSIKRPWLNFEAGAAWLRKIPVVPLCHSGLEPDELPMPLSAMQGGKVSDPETLKRLYLTIAKLIPCGCPETDWKGYSNELSRVTISIDDDKNDSAGLSAPAHQQSSIDDLRISAETGDEKAVQSIAVYQSPEAWSVLMEIAVDNIDDQLKIAAIKGLASFRSPGDITPLCELLVQDRWQVAEACAKALGRFKNPSAIPYLIKASDQHVDWLTTQECATALGIFAPQQPEIICPALIRALEIGSFEGEAASQSLRRYDTFALPYLLSGLEKGALLKGLSLAMKTIVLIGDRKALPRLTALRSSWQENLEGKTREYMLSEIDKAISQLDDTPTSAP